MNLRLILIVALMVLVFTSLLLFSFITYGIYTNTTDKANDHFTSNSLWFYAELGVQLTALVVAGLLFVKR